jgi:hypothetical protein
MPPIDWDAAFKLPRIDLRDRIHRISIISGNIDLRSRLVRALLKHADKNVYIQVGDLVTLLNSTIDLYYPELTASGKRDFDRLRPTLYRQLCEVLIDDDNIRPVVLAGLHETNGLPRPLSRYPSRS